MATSAVLLAALGLAGLADILPVFAARLACPPQGSGSPQGPGRGWSVLLPAHRGFPWVPKLGQGWFAPKFSLRGELGQPPLWGWLGQPPLGQTSPPAGQMGGIGAASEDQGMTRLGASWSPGVVEVSGGAE